MVRRADLLEEAGGKSLRRGAAAVAMRLGPGTPVWRSVPMVNGVVRGPISWAGCHWALLSGRTCQVLLLGIRRWGLSGAGVGREGAKAVEMVGAETFAWATTLTMIWLSPGPRSGPISCQSKAPQALCSPVTTPL